MRHRIQPKLNVDLFFPTQTKPGTPEILFQIPEDTFRFDLSLGVERLCRFILQELVSNVCFQLFKGRIVIDPPIPFGGRAFCFVWTIRTILALVNL